MIGKLQHHLLSVFYSFLFNCEMQLKEVNSQVVTDFSKEVFGEESTKSQFGSDGQLEERRKRRCPVFVRKFKFRIMFLLEGSC